MPNNALVAKTGFGIGLLLMAGGATVRAEDGLPEIERPRSQPSEERIKAIRAAFMAIREPLEYKWVVDVPGASIRVDNSVSHIDLKGELKKFSEGATLIELVYALWPYLDDQEQDAKACIVLLGVIKAPLMHEWFTYRSKKEPRDWPEVRRYLVPRCRTECRRALGEDLQYWYPHQVLFDEDTIGRNCTNAVMRAKYVEAMRAKLRESNFGRDNPLQVKMIFSLLGTLNAKEAAPEGGAYLFYSWKQGGDYRLRPKDEDIDLRPNFGVTTIQDAVLFCLIKQCMVVPFLALDVGSSTLPLVLERYAKTTVLERSMEEGGGCAPAFVLYYFHALRYSKERSIKAIEDYKQANSMLTPDQIAVLNSLVDDIRKGKYQGDRRFFKPDVWGK